MTGRINQRALLGQADGSEVELLVTGTETYATYETPDGYPAVYDDDGGRFCFARVVDGRFESTGVPVTAPPPADVRRHAQESADVRAARITARQEQMERRTGARDEEEQ